MINSLSAVAIKVSPILITLLVITVILVAILITLSIVGRKLQKKSEDSQQQMQAASQVLSMLVIDKKRMKITEAGLPKIVLDQTPKYLRRSKVAIVKAKVGPKIMTLMCDEKIFPLIPVKKEIKAVVSGIYIMDVKGSRNNLETPVKKQGFFQKMKSKVTKSK